MTALTDTILSLTAPLRRRLRLMATRCRLTAESDGDGLERVDVALIGEETRTKVPRVAEYGFASRPKVTATTEGVFLAIGGDRSRGVVIATDDPVARPQDLKEGECALWTPDNGMRVHCKDDGHVDLGTSPEDYVALAKLVKSELDAIKSDLDAIKTWAGSHVHTVSTTGSAAAQTGSTTAVTTSLTLSWSPSDVAAEEVRAK